MKKIHLALVVDNFVTQYDNKEESEYLTKALRAQYEAVSEYGKGELFYGVNIKWKYNIQTVDLIMPGHVEKISH